MRPILIFLLVSQYYCAFSDSVLLNPGDIAIIGYNFKNPDEFSFITFTDLTPGTVIYFTDCGWQDNNSFRPGEGLVTYTVPSPGKNAGEVITFNSDPGFVTSGISGFFGFSVDGDQIFVFQGSFDSPNFIFAINNNGYGWQTTATDNNTSALPQGLTNGMNAVALNETVNNRYNCSLESGTEEVLLEQITNSSNWTGSNVDRVTLPSECFQDPLPVNLISFNVVKKEDKNIITFTAANEHNVYNYEIQKSEDGINYFSITSVKPFGEGNLSNYNFNDFNQCNCYYRLKENEDDGSFYYYYSVFVSAKNTEVLEYYIYDISGVVKFSNNAFGKTEKEILSEKRNFEEGIYFIKMITSDGVIIKKIIK